MKTRYTIKATVISDMPDRDDAYLTEHIEAVVEAPSFIAACRVVRERYSSPNATVFIDRRQARYDCEAVA